MFLGVYEVRIYRRSYFNCMFMSILYVLVNTLSVNNIVLLGVNMGHKRGTGF
jgi:hypothetical protein